LIDFHFSIKPFFYAQKQEVAMSNDFVEVDANKYCGHKNPDSIFNLNGLSIRTLNTLTRAGIKSISVLREMTDNELRRLRNFGEKCLAEVNAAIPNRSGTFKGEEAFINNCREWKKLDMTARRILRFQENDGMKLSEFISSDSTVEGRKRARPILMEYCITFPERINEVLTHFETMQNTSDKLYIVLKLSFDRQQAKQQGLVEF